MIRNFLMDMAARTFAFIGDHLSRIVCFLLGAALGAALF